MLQAVIYGLIFIGVLMVVEGLYLLFFGKQHRQEKSVNRRLKLLESGGDREEVLLQLRKEQQRHENAGEIPLFSIVFKKAAQANISWSPRTIVLLMLALAGVAYVMFTIGTDSSPLVRGIVALALGYASVFIWLRKKAARRLAIFEEQLPDTIDLIVRSLRVGHPISSSINTVASEMPDPIGTDFGLIADENAYGMPVTESLDRLAERIEIPDLRFLAVAVNIQTQSGGNLAEILEGLSQVTRSRFKLFRKISAITAEARWSGWFLSLFPIVALLGIQLVQPNYYDKVSDHPLFMPGAVVVFVLLIINIIFMRWMVNIKV